MRRDASDLCSETSHAHGVINELPGHPEQKEELSRLGGGDGPRQSHEPES